MKIPHDLIKHSVQFTLMMMLAHAPSQAQPLTTIGPGLSISANSSCVSTGSLVVSSGGTLNLTSSTVCLEACGTSLIMDGTCNNLNSTFEYRAACPQTITINPGNGSLTIDNAAGVTLGAPITVAGTLTLANGVFANGSYLTMGNGATIIRRLGSLSAPPIFGAEMNVTYNGTSAIVTGPELPTNTVASTSADGGEKETVLGKDDAVESPDAPSTLQDLTIDNSGGVTLNADATVNDSLKFVSGKLTLGSRQLTIASTGSITGASSSSYVVASGSGTVKRKAVGSTAVAFPIGTVSAYNPATITNSGVTDDFSVRVDATLNNPPAQPTKVVNREWTITEAIAGGSNVTLTLQWNASNQGTGFSTTNPIVIGRHDGTRWNEKIATLGGSDPYTATASGFTSFSPFAVGNTNALRSVILANLKLLLEGPFNTATGLMNNSLRATVLPTQFADRPIPANVVDSIQIEIRGTAGGVASPIAAGSVHASEGEVVVAHSTTTGGQVTDNASTTKDSQVGDKEIALADSKEDEHAKEQLRTSPLMANPNISQAAWLLADGTIRGFTDTTKNYVEYDTTAGNWYVVVRHRNHLAIMSHDAQPLSGSTPTLYDLTTAQSQAYGTNPMKLVGTKYCMYAGDGDASGGINASDKNLVWRPQNGSLGYLGGDLNLSGGVNATDRNLYWRLNNGTVTQVP